MAILTLSQALDRAKAGEPIAPTVPKHQAQLRASMSLATNVLARQAALKEAKRQLQAPPRFAVLPSDSILGGDQVGRGFASLPHPTRQCGLVMLR